MTEPVQKWNSKLGVEDSKITLTLSANRFYTLITPDDKVIYIGYTAAGETIISKERDANVSMTIHEKETPASAETSES